MHLVARRIDVDTADHVVSVQHRVREAGAIGEVARMALEVGKVLLEAHRVRPAAPGAVARRREDVLDARRPRLVVAFVVLGAERLEAEAVRFEPAGRIEPVRNEQGVAG